MTAGSLEALERGGSAHNPLLAFGAEHYSQNDGDGLIEEIACRSMGNRAGTFLKLAVGNGLRNDYTLNLLATGWRGAWLGGEALAFASKNTRLRLKRCWIDRDDVPSLCAETLDAHDIDQPDPLSVDLDGNDHHACASLLAAPLSRFPEISDERQRLSTPATYLRCPSHGHPPSLRTVRSLLG